MKVSSRAALRSARRQQSRGFTLIEVVVALVVLGSSLVVLLGLQSSILTRTIAEQNSQRAMLLARQIMTAVETTPDFGSLSDFDGRIDEVLAELKIISSQDQTLSDEDLNYRAAIEIADWGIPEVNEEAMKRITVTLSWGELPDDQLTVLYFMPTQNPSVPEE